MTEKQKKKAEAQIIKHLQAIERIYERIDPSGDGLNMSVSREVVWAFNAHWALPKDKAINLVDFVQRFDEHDFDN